MATYQANQTSIFFFANCLLMHFRLIAANTSGADEACSYGNSSITASVRENRWEIIWGLAPNLNQEASFSYTFQALKIKKRDNNCNAVYKYKLDKYSAINMALYSYFTRWKQGDFSVWRIISKWNYLIFYLWQIEGC